MIPHITTTPTHQTLLSSPPVLFLSPPPTFASLTRRRLSLLSRSRLSTSFNLRLPLFNSRSYSPPLEHHFTGLLHLRSICGFAFFLDLNLWVSNLGFSNSGFSNLVFWFEFQVFGVDLVVVVVEIGMMVGGGEGGQWGGPGGDGGGW